VLKINEPNQDLRLFDELLLCLEERWDIDQDHIHSVGFSAGAIMADATGAYRGDRLGSVVSYSGAYFCNPDTVNALVAMLQGFVGWPEMAVTNPYAQVFLHGGASDTYNLVVQQIPFAEFAVHDAAFLNARGHDVVICDHGSGHTAPIGFRANQIIEFFAAHPRGQGDSPYRTDGLPADFPGYCTFQPHP